MCGKFTAMVSWAQIVAFSEAFLERRDDDGPGGEGSNDDVATYRVNGLLPVIVWDAEAGCPSSDKLLRMGSIWKRGSCASSD